MSWEPPPTIKRMVWVLDGALNSPFEINLNDRVTVSAGLVMTQYTVLNTPVTSTVPNTPFLYFQIQHMMAGLAMSGCVSNQYRKIIPVPQPPPPALPLPPIDEFVGIPMDATHIALTGVNTNVQMQPGKHVGTMKGGETRSFLVHVRDYLNREHSSSNKLFDWAIIEFEIHETPSARNPLYLVNKVPTIQQTLDTI
jgi:hypothetical protein